MEKLKQFAFILLLAPCLYTKGFVIQTTFNVTNFGAVGNALQVWVSTTAGSPVVAFTNTLTAADIGKTVELFGVGQFNTGNNVNGVYVTNAQDLIAVITNVDGNNNAYLSGDIPTLSSNGVYCIYGTNNVNAFANCLAACPSIATVYIPHGTLSPWGTTNAYLLIPYYQYTNFNYTYYPFGQGAAGILLHRGGLTFQGDGEGQSILMSDGAYKNQGYTCLRAGVFAVIGPITNDFPLIWTNLTFDGGIAVGQDGHQGAQPADWVDGRGWDGFSYAGLDEGTEPLNTFKEFAGCEFRHFRGEMIKGITGSAINETILVTNCYFWDGNATAFNYNYAHTIADCVFSNMYQIEEFYLKYPTNAGSFFINNYATNISHNLVSLNGGTLTNEPYVISNNVFYCDMNGNGIATCPASSVLICSNLFIEQPNAYTLAFAIGQAGAQPGNPNGFNTNITIVGNTFSNSFYMYFTGNGVGAGDPDRVEGMTISNNTVYGAGFVPLVWIGWCSNVVVSGNNCFGSKMQVGAGSGAGAQYALVSTNNNYWTWLLMDGEGGNPIGASYGQGSRYLLTYKEQTNVFTYLSVGDSNQIPVGAQMYFTNGTWNAQPVTVYTAGSNFLGPSVTIPSGTVTVFTWTGSAWIGSGSVISTNNPLVNFIETPTNGIIPMTAQFQTPATDNTGSAITGWNWNFGDGSTSTLQNPSHIYTTTGAFSASLVFTNSNGKVGKGSGAAVVVNQVKLGLLAVAGALTLAWPTNAVGYALQYTTNLTPPVVWRPFLPTPAIINGQYIATSLTTSGPQMFFRLATSFSALITSPSGPKLTLLLAGEKLILTWPASALGFILQSTTNLSPPVVWNAVPATPASVSGQNVVTNLISGPQMFFRLIN